MSRLQNFKIKDTWPQGSKDTGMLKEKERREAWSFAKGLSSVDGLETSAEFKELVEKEIRGEITTADIKKSLDEKYAKERF